MNNATVRLINLFLLKTIGLSGQHTHQRFNCQQGCCVVAQVDAGLHDCVDLFDCVLWLGLGGHGVELSFELFVD